MTADRPGAASRPGLQARPAPWARLAVLSLMALVVFAGFCSLGVWQVQRRAWKLDLIARVDARVHATPAPAPGPAAWPSLTRENSEYRRVEARGVFRNGRETLVQAVTALGPGDWVLTPLATDAGFTVLVNRGFVPDERRDPATRRAGLPSGPVRVVGLLRVSEPKGGFLRANDAAGGRWYSRDVQAIAAAKRLGTVAPYFVDADATPNPGGYPVGGLTVIRFPNSHLVYAITWFGLAAMTLAAWVWLVRTELLSARRPAG